MSKTETLKQSAAAANAQDLTAQARQHLDEVRTLLEQVKKREAAHPLTAEELEQRIEPMLAALVSVAQVNLGAIERAGTAAAQAADSVKSLATGLERASDRAEAASETFRETLLQQNVWQMALCLLSGLAGAALLVAYLIWAGGLKPASVNLNYRDLQEWLQGQLCVMPKRDLMPPRQQPQPQQQRR